MTKNLITALIAFATSSVFGILFAQQEITKNDGTLNFPMESISVKDLPKKDNLWIFIMAGQSNMAGRAFVAPRDTIPNPRILTLDKKNNWVLAKEPLHRYQPNLMGLDCGLSFATELLKHTPDSVSIALIPTAIGGTAVLQWLNDDRKNDVNLWSNLLAKTKNAQTAGILKGMLWHQGEKDAKIGTQNTYENNILKLVKKARIDLNHNDLPIIVGELGIDGTDKANQANRGEINRVLAIIASKDDSIELVRLENSSTYERGHFDAKSVRVMGKKYAHAYLNLISNR